jgi:putative transposase
MPRTARLDIPGQLYHVTARGVERRDIFTDDQDRASFLSRFSALLLETNTDCLAWSLMSNHIHLLLRPGMTGLASFMQRLLTGHAVAYNRRHRRTGHLFQNRYHSILCEKDSYLLPLVRYIHLNPLKTGLVANFEALDRFPWTGHAVVMGNASLAGQQTDQVLGYFSQKERAARREYRAFLKEGIDDSQAPGVPVAGKRDLVRVLRIEQESDSTDERVLGSQAFAERVLPGKHEAPAMRLSLQELMERVAKEFSVTPDGLRSRSRTASLSEARALICHLAITFLKIPGTEVAQYLGQARSSVTRAVRRGEKLAEGKTDWVKAVLCV